MGHTEPTPKDLAGFPAGALDAPPAFDPPPAMIERAKAAYLDIDMGGYTERVRRDYTPEAWARIVARHEDTVRKILAAALAPCRDQAIARAKLLDLCDQFDHELERMPHTMINADVVALIREAVGYGK